MDRIIGFGRDMWDLSVHSIRRADPLLMGAAIAYNSLFALVPLAIAFVTILTFFDATDEVLGNLVQLLDERLPQELSTLITELISESLQWVAASRGWILFVAFVVALWSGSRAVYAVQKALRAVQGVDETRGYVVTRSLGIAVTIGAGAGVLVAYAAVVLGSRVLSAIEEGIGIGQNLTGAIGFVVAVAWVWALLFAMYRWGPPKPMEGAWWIALAVAVLIVIGSAVAFSIAPSGVSTVSFLGSLGVFLVWLYYIGIVVVAAPTVLGALVGAIERQTSR